MLTDSQIHHIYDAICGQKEDGTHYTAVRLNQKIYPVDVTPRTKCRFVRIEDKLKFVEQNPLSGTKENLDLLAAGHKIVHVIPLQERGSWGKIVDGKLERTIPLLEAL